MVSTSINNPGRVSLNIGKTSGVSQRDLIAMAMANKAKQNRPYNQDRTATSNPSNGSSDASTDSSAGSDITTLDDAGNEVLNESDGSYNSGSSDGNSSDSGSGSTSPLLDGSMSYEELIGEICNGIDLIFATKRTTVVVTDYEGIYAEAKYLRDLGHESIKGETVNLWQLEEGTYELEVSEYGFYNTVRVHYKDGVVTEDYQDLVKVYGIMAIDYYDTKIDKNSAIMKAKAYLAAHVRDFDMAIKAQVLFDADIDIGDIITIENPLTMRDKTKTSKKQDPEYLFVKGKSIEWEGDTDIIGNLELRYGAESPERKDVPETGTSYSSSSSGDIETAIDEVGHLASKIKYSGVCQTHDCVQEKQAGDCWGMSDFIACELKSRGVDVTVKQYPTSYAGNHRSVLYKDTNGKWTRFPYRSYNISMLFRDTDAVNSGKDVSTTC